MQPKQQKQEPVASLRPLAAVSVHAEFQIADYSQRLGGCDLMAVRLRPMVKIMSIKCDNCFPIIILKMDLFFPSPCVAKSMALNTRKRHVIVA